MPKHIGIVAVSPEGSALCYRDIFRYASKRLGERGHPVVTLHNLPMKVYVDAVISENWQAVGDMLSLSASVLAAAGAEFCIVPDNLLQYGVHLAEHNSPIPWLTMTDLVCEAVKNDGCSAVGIIAAKLVAFGSTYQTSLGLKGVRVVAPDEKSATMIDDILFRELLAGIVRPESKRRVLDVVAQFKERGCDGIVLACTEAPLLIDQSDSPLPIYDSAKLLAEGALRVAIGERPIKAPMKAPTKGPIGS